MNGSPQNSHGNMDKSTKECISDTWTYGLIYNIGPNKHIVHIITQPNNIQSNWLFFAMS